MAALYRLDAVPVVSTPSQPRSPVFNFTTEWPTGMLRNACRDMDDEEKQILYKLHIIHLVFASLSVAGALSIVLFSVCRRTVRTPEVRPLFHLSVADVLLAICWIIGAVLWEEPMYSTFPYKACTILQAVTEMFNVTTFYLTTNYALNVYVRLKDKVHRSRGQDLLQSSFWIQTSLKVVTVLAWLVPIAIMIPPILRYKTIEEPQSCLQCLILFFTPSAGGFPMIRGWNSYGALYFVISLLMSICAMLVLYILSIRLAYFKLLKSNVWTDKQRNQVRDVIVRITCYFLVFLFCWTPALTLAIMDFTAEVTVQNYTWLFYLQGVTAPSQGFLNCIIYGWTKKSFRMAQHPDRATPLLKQTYRVYGTGEAQTKFPSKLARTPTPTPQTPPPIVPNTSESSLTAYGRSPSVRGSPQWSFSSGPNSDYNSN